MIDTQNKRGQCSRIRDTLRNIDAIFMTENFSFIFKLVAILDSQLRVRLQDLAYTRVNFFLLSLQAAERSLNSLWLRVEACGRSRMRRAVRSMSGPTFLTGHKLL
jgi:hypothetical protein